MAKPGLAELAVVAAGAVAAAYVIKKVPVVGTGVVATAVLGGVAYYAGMNRLGEKPLKLLPGR